MQDEQRLIELAQAGDAEAFLALISRYDRQIMSVVYRFTGDLYDREDLYQEVFLDCFRAIGKFNFRSAFSTWLYRVAMNRCISCLRKKKPTSELTERAAPEPDWERRDKLLAIQKALRRLSGAQRICFHLYYTEDWGIERIAETLDCSTGTVKSHLSRARAKVRMDEEVLVWRTNP